MSFSIYDLPCLQYCASNSTKAYLVLRFCLDSSGNTPNPNITLDHVQCASTGHEWYSIRDSHFNLVFSLCLAGVWNILRKGIHSTTQRSFSLMMHEHIIRFSFLLVLFLVFKHLLVLLLSGVARFLLFIIAVIMCMWASLICVFESSYSNF